MNELNRRQFLAVVAVAGARVIGPAAPAEVEIVAFGDDGRRKGVIRVPKVVKSDDEWRRQLSASSFQITRRHGTERPFSGAYWNLHDRGIFRCVCCANALFASSAKFDSGTGWPSYWEPIAEQNVRHGKASAGYEESEVTCVRCDAHLGDLFSDGPKPTGLRYCIDSVALRFVRY